MEVLFNSPLKSYAENKKALDAAMKRVMASGSYILGEEGRAFATPPSPYSSPTRGEEIVLSAPLP